MAPVLHRRRYPPQRAAPAQRHNDPNSNDPAQWLPYHLHKSARAEHDERVRAQAARYTAAAFEELLKCHCIPAPRVVEGWTTCVEPHSRGPLIRACRSPVALP